MIIFLYLVYVAPIVYGISATIFDDSGAALVTTIAVIALIETYRFVSRKIEEARERKRRETRNTVATEVIPENLLTQSIPASIELLKIFKQKKADYYKREAQPDYSNSLNCPTCNQGTLILRTGRYGRFYGCSKYPACTHAEKLSDFNARVKDDVEEDIFADMERAYG